jgi:acyl-CoA thioesterase-2
MLMGSASLYPYEIRYVEDPPWARTGEANPQQRAWIRIAGTLPDDPLLHACALTYCSDLTLLEATVGRHGEAWGPGGMVGASLDHALWLHRPFRADEWFLYDCSSPSASGARGLATGQMFTVDGRHIATAVQEGLLRRVGG